MRRKPIDETLKDIHLRYKDQDDTQIQKDISYLFMAIRQKEFEYKQLEKKHEQQGKNASQGRTVSSVQ